MTKPLTQIVAEQTQRPCLWCPKRKKRIYVDVCVRNESCPNDCMEKKEER